MSKKNKIQKKKTLANTTLNILFKVLIGIAVIIFAYIIYDKSDFSSSSMTFSSSKKSRSTAGTPSDLRWFDSFKGIENVKDKNGKKSGGSGFKYEGFKK